MPYSKPSDAPSYVPEEKKAQWIAVFNSEWERNKDKPEEEREKISFSAANAVAGPNSPKKKKKLMKASAEDAEHFAQQVIKALRKAFRGLPVELRNSLEQAALSGTGQGMLQVDVSNANLLASANDAAREYAADRAAELIGMKYDEEGNLVENPDARWAISETTRDKIRKIIADAFEKETSMNDVRVAIQKALRAERTGGIFSSARAAMIARTEVMRSQANANFAVWKKSGVVKKTRWLGVGDEKECPECAMNDGTIANIGQSFPSGAILPGDDHPLCRCVLVGEVES